MRFWDSSALVPLLVAQSASPRMKEIAKGDPVMHVWWGTRVECVSAVSRLERLEHRIALGEVTVAMERLERISGNWLEVAPSDSIRHVAQRLLRTHNLRAGDALQLAAALSACEGYPSGMEFVCLDARLNDAALREGFRVVNPVTSGA